jgi:hypothetical protein
VKNLGVAMVGGHGKREKDDFYPTPREAVDALLESTVVGHLRKVWEPACGDGAISKVLESRGIQVVSTDIVDRGYGQGGVDFLETNHLFAPAIITNPPFKLAEQFIHHSLALGAETVAMLLKATFWNAASRLALYREHQPAVVLPLTWRLDFTGGGAPTMDCMWVVWGAGWTLGTTRFVPLAKAAPRFDLLAELT